MDVSIKKDGNDVWGFVESFSKYQTIDTGNIKVVVGISPKGELATPYVFRDDKFIPLQQIDDEMGIIKYIKAKKPFYCKLSEGFIAFIKAGVNYTEKKFLPESTDFIIYTVAGKELEAPNKGTLHLRRVLDVPENLKELMMKLAEDVSKCYGDREAFLRSRM